MPAENNLRNLYERDGRVWLRNAISAHDLAGFDAMAAMQAKAGQRLAPSARLGRLVSKDSSLMEAISRLDPQARPVRVVAFNKTRETNWGVPWHQDRVIAVARRENMDGFENWTEKSGLWHCEPPSHVLYSMLFIRLHLDDTDQSNGAMEIAVGSHRSGVVDAAQARRIALACPIEVCEARRGDVLILNMLTLHASKPATTRTGRRALRIDCACAPLPAPLEWASLDSGYV